MGKSDSPASLTRTRSSPAMSTPVNLVKKPQQQCRVCKGCKRENCGKCKSCLDMVAFGGTGQRKSKCFERVCEKMQPISPAHGQISAQNSPKTQTSTPTNSQKNAQNSPKLQPLTPAHGQKNVQNSPKIKLGTQTQGQKKVQSSPVLKKVASAPSMKGKALISSKAGGSTKTKESSKALQPSKKLKLDYTKTPQVNQKVKQTATSVGTVVHVAAKAEKSPKKTPDTSQKKTSDNPKTLLSSPKSKAHGGDLVQTSYKVIPLNRTLPSPKMKVESNKTPQKSLPSTNENATAASLRFSPRVKPAAHTVTEKSPKVKWQEDENLENNNNLETKATSMNLPTKQFYASATKSKAVDQKDVLTRRKSTDNIVKLSEGKLTSLDSKSAATRDPEIAKHLKQDVSEIVRDCGSSSSERATTVAVKKDIDLPTLKLDSMTKGELKEFIPKLLKLVTGKEEVFYSRRSAKPEWWPEDVTWAASRSAWYSEKYWTDNLKSVVKNCYKHVGKEDLLHSYVTDSNINSRSTDILGTEGIQREDSVKTGSYPSSPVKIRMFPQDLFLPFSAEIYICFFCEKEFLSKETMRSHQKGCKERPPDLQKVYSDVTSCDSVQSVQPPPMSPKKSLGKVWSKLSIDKFTSHLGLVPKLTAAKLREQRLSIEEINCEILDDIEPVSPVTPKTPKSLISQLSRDDSGHATRKRLSYSMSMDSHKEEGTVDTESDSDSESETGKEQKQVHEMNLLDIPISSLLGQRVKNYVHVDSPMSVVEDTSSFCRTPVKNTFLEKLRKKPLAYPILYRPRRIANLHKQNHLYRFKKSEVKEFMCKINTGLNAASIEKVRSMKKFSIRLLRLSRKRLLNWMSRRTLDKQLRGAFKGLKYTPYSEFDDTECEFPSGPTLLVKNIDKLLGLKKRTSQDSSKMSLSLSNFISEEMEAEVSKQKLTLYRSLLYEMSVRKPAVVMEDIGGQVKYSEFDNIGKSQSARKVTKMDVSSKTVEKEVKPRSVFRDVCRKSREERLVAEAKERERKDEYQTLKSLLLAPKSQDNFRLAMTSIQEKTPVSLVVPAVKSDRQSPNDDTVSIMSGSSEGESLHSNCCRGCTDKKHHLVNQGVTKLVSGSDGQSHSTPFIQPLHVDVELSCTPKIDDYGIPSPLSISSESPFPPTPSKSNSGLLDDAGKVMDFTESSPLTKRETRSTRSSGLLSLSSENTACSPSNRPVFSLTSSKSESRLSVPETLMKSSLQRFQSEGMKTRSCSGTPSGSPVKRFTRSGSSAPTSPSKSTKLNKFPLDVKQISVKLEVPASLQSSNSAVRFKLRSGVMVSQGELGKCDSSQKPECSASSPQISAAVSNKLNSGISAVAKNVINKNTDSCDSGMEDGHLRRSKRRSSFLLEDVQPSKLRKVHSDLVVHTR